MTRSGISIEPHSCGPSPALLQRKGKPVIGRHSDPTIKTWLDKPPHREHKSTSQLSWPTRQGRVTITAPYGRYLPCHLARGSVQ